MANEQYIRNRRGTLLTTVKPGKTRNVSTLVLQGYGTTEYGQLRDNNLVYLLENFYGSTAPENPIEGQLWWQQSKELFVWTFTGSPASGKWDNIVPPTDTVGFTIVAGGGLTGGGFPTTSPAEVVLNVGAGTGVRVGSPTGYVTIDESAIDHDSLSGFVSSEHINHTAVTMTAGDGLTGGGDITQTRRFDIGAGDGIEVRPNEIRVDDTVLRVGGSPSNQTTTGDYETSGTAAIAQLAGYNDGGSPRLAFTFINDQSTGIYHGVSTNNFVFAVKNQPVLELRSNGVFGFPYTGSPANLPQHPDDIVTKAYVDALGGSGVSPTENTFVGTSTITGLTTGKVYQVTAYGAVPSKGNATYSVSPITMRSGVSLGFGTVLPTPIGAGSPKFVAASAFTNSHQINWFDGNGVMQITMIVKAVATTMNIQFNDSIYGGIDTYATYSVAVELGDG
jgi:hypothetical protein